MDGNANGFGLTEIFIYDIHMSNIKIVKNYFFHLAKQTNKIPPNPLLALGKNT